MKRGLGIVLALSLCVCVPACSEADAVLNAAEIARRLGVANSCLPSGWESIAGLGAILAGFEREPPELPPGVTCQIAEDGDVWIANTQADLTGDLNPDVGVRFESRFYNSNGTVRSPAPHSLPDGSCTKEQAEDELLDVIDDLLGPSRGYMETDFELTSLLDTFPNGEGTFRFDFGPPPDDPGNPGEIVNISGSGTIRLGACTSSFTISGLRTNEAAYPIGTVVIDLDEAGDTVRVTITLDGSVIAIIKISGVPGEGTLNLDTGDFDFDAP
ncbi:MAG: hypothetical protein ACYSX0_20655 [Planctomycetota bacterium]|jgi:hypothetical protein